MSEYLKTVIATVLSVGVLSALLPKNSFAKYVNIIASIVVMTVLLSPVLKLSRGIDTDFDTLDTQKLTLLESSYVAEEFESELALKLREELEKKTGREFSVEITAEVSEENVVIEKAAIFPYTKDYAGICASYLGIGEDKVVQK